MLLLYKYQFLGPYSSFFCYLTPVYSEMSFFILSLQKDLHGKFLKSEVGWK